MIPEGDQILNVIDRPAPYWKTPQYLVDVAGEDVRAFVIGDYVGDGDHAMCTPVGRMTIDRILAGDASDVDGELAALVLAAGQYRKDHA